MWHDRETSFFSVLLLCLVSMCRAEKKCWPSEWFSKEMEEEVCSSLPLPWVLETSLDASDSYKQFVLESEN